MLATLAATRRRRVMKYICLGYIEPGKLPEMTEGQQQAMLDECFEYDDHLRANGYLAAGEGLPPPETALTQYWKNGKVATTDGPTPRPRSSSAAFWCSRRET
jgi:hypothetical protein